MTDVHTVPLGRIASARSGDKGADANVGVWVTTDAAYAVLLAQVTEERVLAHVRPLAVSRVTRYELPNLRALNFVLHDALDGGGTVSLRSDAQGKTLGAAVLRLPVEVPADVIAATDEGTQADDVTTGEEAPS